MKKLDNKVAIITGASKGIGAATARAFAKEGAAVILNYASDQTSAEKIAAEITAQGGQARTVKADVSKAGDVERLFTETLRLFGKIDIVVNNAGIYRFAPLEAVTEADFHRQFDTNVLGTILTIQQAAKHLPEGGSIINTSTIASTNPVAYSLVYAASKSAVDTVTKAMAKELGPKKIRVNTIAPGATITEGIAALDLPEEFGQQMIAGTPLGRLGQPEDIAKVAVFLASDDAAWVTGERLTVSGGYK
ncbi:MAG: glucose 1-dehydrogenase [Bacteroidetes bacterium]|nr:glucose 1-dehydrogenase [Bacteroidota bacterium]